MLSIWFQVLQHLTLGMDLEVSHLTIHTQRLLSLLLDPADPMGRDWCLLAVTLGLSDYLPTLDNDDQKQVSQTQRVLAEWTRRCDATVRDLVMHLKDFNRIDAVEAILRTTPPCRTLTYEDQSTDESGGAHGTDASTNTLSNLSRWPESRSSHAWQMENDLLERWTVTREWNQPSVFGNGDKRVQSIFIH